MKQHRRPGKTAGMLELEEEDDEQGNGRGPW